MELKPCPFCGGKALLIASKCEPEYQRPYNAQFSFSIRCEECDATAPKAYGYITVRIDYNGNLTVCHDDRPNAIAAWNRRKET